MKSPFLWAMRNATAANMAYRANFVAFYLLRVVQLFILLVVWRAVFTSEGVINGYTWETIAGYFILMNAFSMILSPSHMFDLHPLVRKGTLSAVLIRPFSYERLCWAGILGKKLPILAGAFVYGVVVCLILRVHLAIHITPIILGLVVLSGFISVYLGLTISTLAFWLIEMWPLKRLFQGCMILLGGLAAPLPLYPLLLRAIASYSPFPFVGYVPVAALTGTLSASDVSWYSVAALIWSIVLFMIFRLFWILGIKRYQAVNN